MEPQQLAAPAGQQTVPLLPRKSVLNVGFGIGIIDTYLQEQHQPVHHIIIEAHPDVYQRMLATGWGNKPNVCICFGKWQTVIPQLIAEGVVVDAIFYDIVSPRDTRELRCCCAVMSMQFIHSFTIVHWMYSATF